MKAVKYLLEMFPENQLYIYHTPKSNLTNQENTICKVELLHTSTSFMW